MATKDLVSQLKAYQAQITEPQFRPRNTPPSVLFVSQRILHVTTVDQASWSDELPNLSDYDVVLLDLVSLSETFLAYNVSLARSPDELKKHVAQLLTAFGMVICIMPPVEAFEDTVHPWASPYWWSPIPLKNLQEAGATWHAVDPRLRRYFDRCIHSWTTRPALARGSGGQSGGRKVAFRMRALVESRSSLPLAAQVYWQLMGKGFLGLETAEFTSGYIVILPAPDKTTVEESVQIVLNDFLGISTETPPPSWLGQYTLPGEDGRRSALQPLVAQRTRIDAEISTANEELRQLTEHKRLLYADGQELETAVWRAMETLGATVHHSAVEGREDRWLEVSKLGLKGVMEIKGHTRGMKRDDARQADDWVSVRFHSTGETLKGILIGNPYRLEEPAKRPAPWSKEIVEYAKAKRLALITTVQLYEAVKRAAEGAGIGEDLFQRIANTDGVVEF